MGWIQRIDDSVARVLRWGAWLVMPVALLLFAQWPLRDLVQAYSRDANDLAQWLFAIYVALALTAATRGRAHLAADMLARRYTDKTRAAIGRIASLVLVAPWALFVVLSGAGTTWRSLLLLEGFPDTYNPGYFLVKLAAWLLALLVLVQALLDALRPAATQ